MILSRRQKIAYKNNFFCPFYDVDACRSIGVACHTSVHINLYIFFMVALCFFFFYTSTLILHLVIHNVSVAAILINETVG